MPTLRFMKMTTNILSNIHNNIDGYNKLVNLYEEHKSTPQRR